MFYFARCMNIISVAAGAAR